MKALDWPNTKKHQRTKEHKELFKKAYPSELRPKKKISLDDLKKVLGR